APSGRARPHALWAVVSDWATYSGVVSGNTGHLTRGGLASALNEIAAAGVSMRVQERTVPIREVVHGACEILGLDPLYVTDEGRFAIVPVEHADAALDVLLRCSGCLLPSRPPASV